MVGLLGSRIRFYLKLTNIFQNSHTLTIHCTFFLDNWGFLEEHIRESAQATMAESNGNNSEQQFYEGQEEAGGSNQQGEASASADNQSGDLTGNEAMGEDADLFDIKQRVKGMDEEAARLIQLQTEMEQQMKSAGSPTTSMHLSFFWQN